MKTKQMVKLPSGTWVNASEVVSIEATAMLTMGVKLPSMEYMQDSELTNGVLVVMKSGREHRSPIGTHQDSEMWVSRLADEINECVGSEGTA